MVFFAKIVINTINLCQFGIHLVINLYKALRDCFVLPPALIKKLKNRQTVHLLQYLLLLVYSVLFHHFVTKDNTILDKYANNADIPFIMNNLKILLFIMTLQIFIYLVKNSNLKFCLILVIMIMSLIRIEEIVYN